MTLAAAPPETPSFYPLRLEDPKAVYVTPDHFTVHADGLGDDTAAIQQAIDRVQETTGQGIVFLPSGRYRVSRQISVWPGVRVIGYGPTRPTLVLGANTPGYQDAERYMVFFAGRRPQGGAPAPEPAGGVPGTDFEMPNEANPGTFYSAMSNVDVEIQDGNPSAVAIRGRYAQLCYLAHMTFRLGSAFAGIHDTGNEADDLHFIGGKYGLITRTPSPGWQFTLLDSTFEGQTEAAIRTHVTGLTLIRPTFRKVPTAIEVVPDQTEQLWMSDARMEEISGPAIAISRENSLRTQINVRNVTCRHTPVFAWFRESGRTLNAPGDQYRVTSLSHGLGYADLRAEGKIETEYRVEPLAKWPEAVRSDVPALPPADTWVSVTSLGAKGDGTTDDTAALRAAIAKHRTLYFPSGKYRVTDTLELKPDTVLIGLNPITTQIVVTDGTPAFMGVAEPEPANGRGGRRGGLVFAGGPKALLQSPRGGTNVVTGLGLDAGGNNPSAVAALWMAGRDSMMDDVKFLGGHGSNAGAIYNQNNSADPNPERKWDSQYPSLWVTNGGGGTFKNLWTASPFASAGMLITDTTTEGRVYQMSSEHHVRYEVQLRNAANWSLYALQTEEERGESSFALPLEIDRCRDILVANLNMYRVVSVAQPFPYAVKVSDSRNVEFRNVHCYSNSKVSFDNLLFDQTHGVELRQREFANLVLTGDAPKARAAVASKLLARGAKVEKLASGFHNISGGAVDSKGDYYFVDYRWNRIYRWDAARKQLSVVQDAPLYATNLAFDKSDNLLAISYAGRGTVYTFRPDNSKEPEIKVLKAEATRPRPGASAALPVTDWQLNGSVVRGQPLTRPHQFVSPDGSTFIPASQEFLDGSLTWGVKLQDVIRTFGLSPAKPGQPFYVMGESETRTYRVDVAPDGSMTNGKLFAEQGGEGVAVDPAGNVYIAAGQIYVYDAAGRKVETIEVPERPTQLMFGGKDGKTLFIAARSSLYSVRIR